MRIVEIREKFEELKEVEEGSERWVDLAKYVVDSSRELFHNEGVPEEKCALTNNEYDELINKYEEITGERPVGQVPTNKGPANNERPVDTPHEYPELTCYMKKAKTYDDVFEWLDNVFSGVNPNEEVSLLVMYKYNGVSVVMDLVDGMVRSAITRGDTQLGVNVTDIFSEPEDVVKAVREIKSDVTNATTERVKQELEKVIDINKLMFPTAVCELGGQLGLKTEVMMTYENFDKLNETLDTPYINPLSATTGLLRRSDGRDFRKYLTVVPLEEKYEKDVPRGEDSCAALDYLFASDVHFKYIELTGKLEMIKKKFLIISKQINKDRPDMNYSIDGLVLEVLDKGIRDELGVDKSVRKYQLAYKFPDEFEITPFREMEYNVGFTGKINAKMHYVPVEFEGKTMTKTSMGSYKKFKRFNLHENDDIKVTYSNGVLCDISPVEQEHTGKKVEYIKNCPSCGKELKLVDADYYCVNDNCVDKNATGLARFAERIGIRHLGLASVEKLFESGMATTPLELISLERKHLLNILGENGVKIYREIQKALDGIYEWEFFNALCIPNVSVEKFKSILTEIKPDTLIDYKKPEIMPLLIKVDGIGEKTAEAIADFMEENYEWIVALFDEFTLKFDPTIENEKVAVLTGTRDSEVIDKLQDAGYNIKKSITEDTDLLVYKNKDTSKYREAQADDSIDLVSVEDLDGYLGI